MTTSTTVSLLRPVTFGLLDANRVLIDTYTAPIGTQVYARPRKNGLVTLRIPGTLFQQDVNPLFTIA